ncbi:MAG TPA: carbohydrate kinase family protein [Clostridia bacterium]|nr:carbohydrate kinase family protein [Clostridia bacterium]
MGGYIVVAGGTNVDIKGKSFGRMDIGSSSPGAIEISPGGVGRNIAHNLALLNMPVTLLSAIGSDAQGARVLQETADSGVCIGHVLHASESLTGTYIALLDSRGEMIAALSDMQILDRLDAAYFKDRLPVLREAGFIVCDANLSLEALKYIIAAAGSCGIPVCLEPVSVKKALKLKQYLKGIDYITPSLDELCALSGMDEKNEKAELMAAQLIESGVKNVITTLGKDGLLYTNSSGSTHYPSIATNVADVTGAGDSLTAGFIYGLMRHKSIDKALGCGLAAAAITISSKETVSPLLSEERLEALTALGRLDDML